MDARLIYFPFISCMIVSLALNIVGGRIKLKHRKITNFLITLGIIEHVALIT
jgi:hypothetical protein